MQTLINLLEDVMPMATICTITTLTQVQMVKRGNPYKDTPILKYAIRNCKFGGNYENAVNNHIERVGGARDFKADSLPWGKWKVFGRTIDNHGTIHGRFQTLPNAVIKSVYIIDGRVATESEVEIIKRFEKKHNSTKQDNAGLHGKEQVSVYSPKLENILKVVWGENEWVSEDYASATAIATK